MENGHPEGLSRDKILGDIEAAFAESAGFNHMSPYELINHADPFARKMAVNLLSKESTAVVVNALILALGDPYTIVRTAAYKALTKMADISTALVNAFKFRLTSDIKEWRLSDSDQLIRVNVARLLGETKISEAAERNYLISEIVWILNQIIKLHSDSFDISILYLIGSLVNLIDEEVSKEMLTDIERFLHKEFLSENAENV